jgi:hypothetical protein
MRLVATADIEKPTVSATIGRGSVQQHLARRTGASESLVTGWAWLMGQSVVAACKARARPVSRPLERPTMDRAPGPALPV